jgi:hypothetical protein
MVFAVQCPNPKCRKYMLVEEQARNGIVKCLICRTDIRIAGEQKPSPPRSKTT